MEQGLKGGDTGSAACSRPQLLVLETWRSAASDQRGSWTWETGPAAEPPLSTTASFIPYIPRPGRGGVGSALPLVSLEMIACPRARREEAAQLQTLRASWKGNFFILFFKAYISSPSGGICWPKTQWRFSPFGEERGVFHFIRKWIIYHIILCRRRLEYFGLVVRLVLRVQLQKASMFWMNRGKGKNNTSNNILLSRFALLV